MFSHRFKCINNNEKVTISVGQALLILIEKYQDHERLYDKLKLLYLVGADDEGHAQWMNELLQDEILQPYRISKDMEFISLDPSRRYFESMLAFGVLCNTVSALKMQDLKNLLHSIFDLLPESQKRYLVEITEANEIDFFTDPTGREMQDALKNIKSKDVYAEFSTCEKEKMHVIIMIVYASLNLACSTPDLPLEVYSEGYFGRNNRGRITKPDVDQAEVKSRNFGLLKSFMPLAIDETLYDKTGSSCLRVADRNNFKPESAWAIDNFNRLVHPFSSSISGTMLAFLRTLNYLHCSYDVTEFSEITEFSDLIKAISSLLLINSGGHTLHEFISVLQIPIVQDGFDYIEGFEENMNLQNLFLYIPNDAFNVVLSETIIYNNTLLNKSRVHAFLKSPYSQCNSNDDNYSDDEDNEKTQSCSTPRRK